MSEWRRTPLAMHQRRGAGGGVRACGARERARARERERRGARAAERDSIADGTALRCGRVGSRHFRELEENPRALLFLCLLRYSLHVAVLYRGYRCVLPRCAGPLHLRSSYLFVSFDKFVVADEAIDGYNESAYKVKN